MINIDNNSYISAILSQKSIWTTDEIIEQFNKLLAPFAAIDSIAELSTDVTFLHRVVDELPYKLSSYKYIVDNLYKENGMACNELSINVFNADFGIDLIAFLSKLIDKGYAEDDIKSIRLFSEDKERLSKALLLSHAIFPELNVTAHDLSIKDVNKECACDSILTVNIFPHTFHLGNKQYNDISKLLIKSHFIYSHSIFYEFVDTEDDNSVPLIDCDYYWDDLTKCRFYQKDPSKYTFTPRTKIGNRSNKSKYAIFSTLSIEDLSIKHEYKIVLPNLCPGTPKRLLFNEKQHLLFYDAPLKGSTRCEDIDDTTIVAKGFDNTNISSLIKNERTIRYTLRKAIEEFPQYEISQGMSNNEEWAFKVYEFYYNEANNGNIACYNNLGVLNVLCYSCSDGFDDINSEINKTIIGLFEMAANGGDTSAMINLASLYMARGFKEKGIEYYKMASDKGEATGSYSMGIAHQFGLYGCTKDSSIAIEYYQKCIKQYFEEIKTDSSNHTPISNCCLNLIMLMYQEDYPFVEIVKAFNKIEKPSDELVYAYTVISNNMTNKAKDFFKVLKLKDIEEKEPSYVTYNRLCALYNGIKNSKDSLDSDKEAAIKQLKELAETECPDWPEWKEYIYPNLAYWINEQDSDCLDYLKYWELAITARPHRECAFRTNIAISEKLPDSETRAIWKRFAYGEGCNSCHECTKYDLLKRCCPKAQYKWATKYEENPEAAKELLEAAIAQNYVGAMEQEFIYNYRERFLPDAKDTAIDGIFFNFGIVPGTFSTIIDKFAEDSSYTNLSRTADEGSRKAAALLVKASSLRNNKYESIYWNSMSGRITNNISAIEQIITRTIKDDYFYPETIAEQDYIKYVNQKAEQFLGEKEEAFEFLKTLAEFYVRGECLSKALSLYKIAKEKECDVDERIKELEEEIERIERENSQYDYDDYDYDDYRDDGVNWDYYNPNLDFDQQDPEFWD